MKKTKLFIDFDGVYEHKKPHEDMVVLTNKYSNSWSFNVNGEIKSKNDNYLLFERFSTRLVEQAINLGVPLKVLKMYFWLYCFFPLGQWFSTIDRLLKEKVISREVTVVFSSYSSNRKIFVFEAEGERNSQFLYKKSYFISFYLDQFLKEQGFVNIIFKKKVSLYAKLSFLIRGPLVTIVKFLQLIVYKFFTLKRKYGDFDKTKSLNITVSTRGIVQSQFIEGLYDNAKNHMLVYVNESSTYPYRNLKLAKNTFENFYFAEGYLSLSYLFKEFFNVIKGYLRGNNTHVEEYRGVRVNVYDLMPEVGVKLFHLKTYAKSLANSINKFNNEIEQRKIISFEMTPPFSHFIKEYTKMNVVQVQSTLMSTEKFPDFVYSDRFYFNNQKVYEDFCRVNPSYAEKFDVLHNLKYLGLKKESRKVKFKNLVYFTQPIYFDEEEDLINYLKSFCDFNNMNFFIKLHPRSKTPDVAKEGIKVYDGSKSSQEIIKEIADVVVTRNSSVGLDSWYLNVPVLFFVDGTLNGDTMSYIPDDYLGVLNKRPSIKKLSSELQKITHDFYEHPFQKETEVKEKSLIVELLKDL